MIALEIPGYGAVRLAHLVLDYNGTLAVDGRLASGVTVHLSSITIDGGSTKSP